MLMPTRPLLTLAILLTGAPAALASLAPLPAEDGVDTRPRGLSSNGQIVIGSSRQSDITQALRWDASGALQPLGSLGGDYSMPWAVSADGSVIAGTSKLPNHEVRAFVWTAGQGMQDIGDLGGQDTRALAVSADGRIVAGSGQTASGDSHLFRWTAEGGLQDVTPGHDVGLDLIAMSADGSTLIGMGAEPSTHYPLPPYRYSVRWTAEGGIQDLGRLSNDGWFTEAIAVSADGSVVAGDASLRDGIHAFRWTVSGGIQDLGMPSGAAHAMVSALSADGSTVVGDLLFSEGRRAFRWTPDAGMQDLGTLGSGGNHATAVSADGRVVVGAEYSQGLGFHWSPAGGMQSIADWAAVTDSGFTQLIPVAVSADGQVVTGFGSRGDDTLPQPWIARSSGIIQPAQWLHSVSGTHQTFQSAQYLSNLILNGAHHRPLASHAGSSGDGSCVWANGDWGRHGDNRDAEVALAEVGVCGHAGNLLAGLSLGRGSQHQSLPLDGEQDLDGRFVVGELNWAVPQSSILLSALAMYGRWDADIDRSYRNGTAPDSSSGRTDVEASALRLRADWLDAARIGDLGLSPWGAFTVTRMEVDGYHETGGGFPARFDSQQHTAREVRVGVNAHYPLSASTSLTPSLEAIHRLDQQGPDLSGQAIGLFSFRQPGNDIDRHWLRAGLDIDHRVSEAGLLSLSLHGATEGQDATRSVALKYLHRF